MGLLFSRRIGSDPYYASYERSFEHIKAETDRLKVSLYRRKNKQESVGNTIFFYGAVGFAMAVVGAAWVVQQPAGTYTPQQHSLRVAPLFLEPLLAYMLYYVMLSCLSLYHRRDRRKLETLNSKMRKMVAELKDSTHYEKTLKLLEKYDPDFVPPTPRKQQLPRMGPGSPRPLDPQRGGGPLVAQRRSSLGPLQHVTDAGRTLMPAFDKLANTLIGDNPALMQALRGAQLEVEELKRQNNQAEARIMELQRRNAELRMQLGLPPEDGGTKALPWQEGVSTDHGQQREGAEQETPDCGVIIEEAEDDAEHIDGPLYRGGSNQPGAADAVPEKEPPVEID
ncbi:g97 [Coccomyxa elongata]